MTGRTLAPAPGAGGPATLARSRSWPLFDPGREQALGQPHVRPMQFGGRALSGFICVEPDGFAADDALARWVQRGLDFVAGLPAKAARTRR